MQELIKSFGIINNKKDKMKSINNTLLLLLMILVTVSCDTDGGTSVIDYQTGAVADLDKDEDFPAFLNLTSLSAGEDVEIGYNVEIQYGDVESLDLIGFYQTADELFGPVTLRSNIQEFPGSGILTSNEILNAFPELESADDFELGDQLILTTKLYLEDGRTIEMLNDDGSRRYGSDIHTSSLYNVQVSYPLSCPSNLGGEFTWVASDFVSQGESLGDLDFPSGTGSLEPTAPGATTYLYESGYFDFGYYCLVYNGEEPDCDDGATGNLQLSDICGILSYTGTDQFGDAYEITNVEVDGKELTFSWSSAFGEGSTVTLTRTDGTEWPDNLRTE